MLRPSDVSVESSSELRLGTFNGGHGLHSKLGQILSRTGMGAGQLAAYIVGLHECGASVAWHDMASAEWYVAVESPKKHTGVVLLVLRRLWPSGRQQWSDGNGSVRPRVSLCSVW